MSPTLTIPTMQLCGHTFVRNGPDWVSQAPFTTAEYLSVADQQRAGHRQFGILTERRGGDGAVQHSLLPISSVETLRQWMGVDRVPEGFGGRSIACNDDYTVAGVEFFIPDGNGDPDSLLLPMIDVTYFHAVATCLAIGAGLMTDDQYVRVVSGKNGRRQHATPNGQLNGSGGEEQVVSSIVQMRKGPVAVGDSRFPWDPRTGTWGYTGEVWKWMTRNYGEMSQFGLRGGSWFNYLPGNFAASYRHYFHPVNHYDYVGFLAAVPVQDS